MVTIMQPPKEVKLLPESTVLRSSFKEVAFPSIDAVQNKPEIGWSVDLEDRALNLKFALKALCDAHMEDMVYQNFFNSIERGGNGTAHIYPDPENIAELHKIERDSYRSKAASDFLRAYRPKVQLGALSLQTILNTDDDYRRFLDKFSGRQGFGARKTYKEKWGEQEKLLKKQRGDSHA